MNVLSYPDMSANERSIWPRIESDEFEAALADNLRAFELTPVSQQPDNNTKIICLGESHGSHLFAMSGGTLPGAGGLLLRFPPAMSPDLILDPGWGCIAAARRREIPLTGVGIILVSHCHLDHVGDLNPLLITLSLSGKKPV